MIAVIIIAVLLGIMLAVPLAFFVVGMQAAAKRNAYKLLESDFLDPKDVKKTIRSLGKDAESEELVHRLMNARLRGPHIAVKVGHPPVPDPDTDPGATRPQ